MHLAVLPTAVVRILGHTLTICNVLSDLDTANAIKSKMSKSSSRIMVAQL